MKHSAKNILISFLLLTFSVTTHSRGFAHGTLVKTPRGYRYIEDIRAGDMVIAFNCKQKMFVVNRVTKTVSYTSNNCAKIICQNESIITDYNQQFYDKDSNCWIALDDNGPHPPLQKGTYHSVGPAPPTLLYDLVVDPHHNFCITTRDIIVHNFDGIICAGSVVTLTSVAMPASIIASCVPYVAPVIVGATALWFVGKTAAHYIRKNRNNNTSNNVQSSDVSRQYYGYPSPDPQNPKDPEKNKNRKVNTVSKKEFFDKISSDYEHYKNGIYRRIKGAKGIDKVKYFDWDHLHGDAEAYNTGKLHLGSYDPETLMLYKHAVYGRDLFKKLS